MDHVVHDERNDEDNHDNYGGQPADPDEWPNVYNVDNDVYSDVYNDDNEDYYESPA